MDKLNATTLKSLLAHQGKWCVSLYMPTHRMGREQQQDPIRLRNLLSEAGSRLLESGLRSPVAKNLMRPAEELLGNRDFWRHQSDGLAVFLAQDFSEVYRLPVKFEEQLMTGTSFYIKPLLPCLSRAKKFYLLAVSLKNLRLFEGTADSLVELELNFPTAMDEALWMDDPEKHLNIHTSSGSSAEGQARSAGIFHGHTPEEDEKKNIARFFQSVNQGLNEHLEEKDAPIVLAGVDYLLSIYRETNSQIKALRHSISGNVDRESLDELRDRAWEIVKPIFEEDQKKSLERYEQLRGQKSKLAIAGIDAVVRAATLGQVETLFVPLTLQRWGWYDAQRNEVIVEDQPRPENRDLLDFAASETILNSGQVFALPVENMPGMEEVAAILRYTA